MVGNISSDDKKEVVELLVAIAVLAVFLLPALEMEGPVGQFPRLFLIAGLLFLGIEVAIRFLPQPYKDVALNFTAGLTSEMTEDVQQEVEEKTDADEPAAGDGASVGTPVVESDAGNLALFLALLAGFYLLSYLIGFLWAIPILTGAIIYLFGDWDWTAWLLATAIFMALVYGLFGEVMNIPVSEGVFP